MAASKSFRVGRVKVYLRGRVWYLCYFENGKRRRPRVGPDRQAAKQLAAQVNAQIEVGAPAATSFEQVSIVELRQRWLEHHEQVRRSSLNTIRRYRAATAHLIRFVEHEKPVKHAGQFTATHAEAFVRYMRQTQVAPNGHAHAAKRSLRGKGLKFVLESCRAMFNFAARRRHLPPYADNPFTVIEVDRIPVEDAKPIELLGAEQERQLLEACDDWQLPIFLTLMLTGMRPGELIHLLLPEDLDLEEGWVHVKNKPTLGWAVKTRNERSIPLVPELAQVLKVHIADRRGGPVFRRQRFDQGGDIPVLAGMSLPAIEKALARREAELNRPLERIERQKLCQHLWRDLGAVKYDRLRQHFMRLTRDIGLPHLTTPKTLRHQFATALQEAGVDPLIRNQLMGHSPARGGGPTAELGMTAVYTHTRPQTMRRQLLEAMKDRRHWAPSARPGGCVRRHSPRSHSVARTPRTASA